MMPEIALALQTCICTRLAAVGRPVKCCCIGLERPLNEAAYVVVAPSRVEPNDDILESNCLPTSFRVRFSVLIGRCIKDNTCNGTSSESTTFMDDVEDAMFAISCCDLPGRLKQAAIFQVNYRIFEDQNGTVFNEAEIIVEVKVPRPWGVPV